MAIRTTCPSCRTVYALADHLAGKKVRCKTCGEAIAVRASTTSADADRDESESGRGIQPRPQASRRSPVPEEEDAPRPRRHNRDEERDYSLPIRRDNHGLMIALIACGAGLVLLLAGGVLVIVLLVANRSATPPPDIAVNVHDPRLPAGMADGIPDSVVVQISGVADNNTSEAITEKLEALAADAGHFSLNTVRRGDRMTVIVAPVRDIQAFSQRLDFGTVDSIEGRTINMTARKVQGPPANADVVARALHQLKSPNVHKRHEALRKLKDTLPDNERRAEVVKALEPLLNDPDFFTRKFAVEALGVWATKDAVPILLKAMKDKDTRGDAMKALGRLKDERAAEPIAERLDEFFDRHDAEEALKQMGPIAEKAVLARLNHHDWQVRVTACRILAAIGTKESIPPLEKAVAAGKGPLAGENFHVAVEAERAIKAIKARQ